MRRLLIISAAAVGVGCAGCVATPGLEGGLFAPSFIALQTLCGSQPVAYGDEAQPVYSAFFDAYIALRHGKLSKPEFCDFQARIAQQHAAAVAANTLEARSRWGLFLNAERANALSWRAAVDPSLRGG